MDTSHGQQGSVAVRGENLGPRDDSDPDQAESGQTVETTFQPKGKAGRPTKQAQAKEARKQETQEKRAATRAANKEAMPTASQAKSEKKRIYANKQEPPTSAMPPVQIQYQPANADLIRQRAEQLDAAKLILDRQVAALSPRDQEVWRDLQTEYEDRFLSRPDVDIQKALEVGKMPPDKFIDLMTDENGRKAIIAKVIALIGKGKK